MEHSLKTIAFTLMHEGEAMSNIISIVISDMSAEEFINCFEGGFLQFIAELGDVSLGYNIIGDPPIELLEDETKQDLLNELIRMVNEDVPEIVSQINTREDCCSRDNLIWLPFCDCSGRLFQIN